MACLKTLRVLCYSLKSMAQIIDRVKACPYSRHLGIEVVEVSPGYAKVTGVVTSEHANWLGRTHGGWVMSIADAAFSISSNTVPGIYVAVQFNINFVGNPPIGERVWAEGRVEHQGKTLAVVDIRVTDSQGRTLATATGTAVAVGEKGSKG